MPTDKDKDAISKLFKRFIDETEEPRAEAQDKDGAFIGVGKLRKPTKHFGENVNVVSIRTGHFKDKRGVEHTRWDTRIDELKIFRNCCNKVLKEWK